MELDEAMQKAAEHLESQASESPNSEPAPAAVSEPPSPAPAVETPAETLTPAQQRARDEAGRFTKGAKTPAQKAPAAPKGDVNGAAVPAPAAGLVDAGGGVPPAPPPAKAVEPPKAPAKLPQSWRPHLRDLAAKLPPEFHPLIEESVRVDEHVRRALNETTEARQFASSVVEQLRPYEGIAKANGQDAMAFAAEGLQERAAIYAGAPQYALAAASKLLRVLVQRFGDGVYEHLNAAMAGQPGAAALPQAQQQPDVEALIERRFQEQAQRAEMAQADRSLEEFLGTQPEFIDSVWQDMQLILRASAQGGRNMTFQQAYDRACRMNDDVQKALDGRKATEQARTATAATEQARAAAVSIKSTPGAPVRQAGTRMGVDAAMDKARAKLGM